MEGVKVVVLDIEGTVCPISFVKDVLFPYAIKALPDVLAEKWDASEFKPYRNNFPEEYRQDPAVLQAHVEDLTKRDVKIAYLKNLQGFLWEEGYRNGAYSTSLFTDVVPALQQWKDDGYSLAIYSSGSVFAQKLLFGHVQVAQTPASKNGDRPAGDHSEDHATDDAARPPSKKIATDGSETTHSADDQRDQDSKGTISETDDATSKNNPASTRGDADDDDETAEQAAAEDGNMNGQLKSDEKSVRSADLTGLFDAWFDTVNAGLKTEARSYEKIAEELQCQPGVVLFLSDNVKEVDAAIEAGMKAIVVDRPGNAPISDEDRERLQLVTSLREIMLPAGGRN